MAITLLVLVLAVGGFALFVFLQFLSTVRENQRSFREIMSELGALKKKVDAVAKPADPKAPAERSD